ncbi:MAG: lipid-A-disaccharide synthase [Alphaproteobacteria bacterium]|nr:lipid-A-disaccharide synthase [Alphaproteobacteria bacterium]
MSKKIFLIAGEASGDSLGASLIHALRTKMPENSIGFKGVGGPAMEKEGLNSLLSMKEMTVMGLWEAVSHLPRLFKLRTAIVNEIERYDPDVVITIDFPDFNFQVASLLKKRGISRAKLVHYVAPTVWAWRPGRAKRISAFLDGLLCLFPFEPDYFKPHGLDAVFAGHPLIEHKVQKEDALTLKEALGIPLDTPTIGLFFGSREEEIKKMGDVLRDTVVILLEQYPDIQIIVPTLPHLEFEVLQRLEGLEGDVYVIKDQERKWEAFMACDVALAVSGTVGLELAYVGIPHVIAYKMHPLSWLLVRLLVKVKHAHLANILLGRTVVPEFLQKNCHPVKIAQPLLKMLKDGQARQKQIDALSGIKGLLTAESGKLPSESAADFILKIMADEVVDSPDVAQGNVPESAEVASGH